MSQESGGSSGTRLPGQTVDEGWGGAQEAAVGETPPPSQVDRGWDDTGGADRTEERPTELPEGFEDWELVDAGSGIAGSRDEYPFATEEDFEEDQGDWTDEDYESTAQVLFGGGEGFGETALQRWQAEGFELLPNNDAYRASIAQHVPGITSTVSFFAGEPVVAMGFARLDVLRRLLQVFPSIDWSRVHVTLPQHTRPAPQRPRLLPAALRAIQPAAKADLRTPSATVGDQMQTGRCTAFAWTHAIEMSGPVFGIPVPGLSCSFAAMQLQRKQGDFVDHASAWAGGDGARTEAEPHTTFPMFGTCRAEMWPDDAAEPSATDDQMAWDAQRFKLPARVLPIVLADAKKVLTAGCPVVVTMTAGPAFAELGRDGIFSPAAQASAEHGYHCLLIVGYVGNYFILKNCWGEEWGDGGYCYVPRPALKRAAPLLQAIVWDQQLLVHPGPDTPFGFELDEEPTQAEAVQAAAVQAEPAAVDDIANARTEPPPPDLMPDFGTMPSAPSFKQTSTGIAAPAAATAPQLFGAPAVPGPPAGVQIHRAPEVTPPLSRIQPQPAGTMQSVQHPAASPGMPPAQTRIGPEPPVLSMPLPPPVPSQASAPKSGTAPGYARLPAQVAAAIAAEQQPVPSMQRPEAPVPSMQRPEAPVPSMAQPVSAAMQCPKCGRLTAGRFCEGCGSPMIEVAKFCRQCGTKLRQGAKFCTQCACATE